MTTQNALPAGLVNPRLRKELRMLRLPAVITVLAAFLVPVFTLLDYSASPGEGVFSLLKGFAWLGFLGCILLMCSVPFGWEFQHRTLPMLLAQPFPRSQMWKEKMAAPILWVLGILVVAWVVQYVLLRTLLPSHSLITQDLFGGVRAIEARHFIQTDMAFLLLFVPATLCAAPVWVMTTRSTVGGVTFTVASQGIAAIVANGISEKAHLPEGPAFIVGAVFYTLGFLWLGWRMFSALQVADGVGLAASQSDLRPSAGSVSWRDKLRRNWAGKVAEATWLDRLFRCRAAGSTANLFRKELRLQKPVYQVGAFFALCWVLIFALTLLQPGKGYQNLFDVIIAFHVPLVFLLAGSISISDENALGISGWHLTLPVPAGRQWTVKLVSSLGAGVAVGWVLPLMMLWATSFISQTGYTSRWVIGIGAIGEAGLFLICLSVALFLASFWAVSLVGNTMRAVMMALLGIVVLFFAFLLAHWWARTNGGFSAHLVPAFVLFNGQYVLAACLLALASTALAQTLLVFRRPDVLRKPLIIYPAVLVFGALLIGAVIGELEAAKLKGYL